MSTSFLRRGRAAFTTFAPTPTDLRRVPEVQIITAIPITVHRWAMGQSAWYIALPAQECACEAGSDQQWDLRTGQRAVSSPEWLETPVCLSF